MNCRARLAQALEVEIVGNFNPVREDITIDDKGIPMDLPHLGQKRERLAALLKCPQTQHIEILNQFDSGTGVMFQTGIIGKGLLILFGGRYLNGEKSLLGISSRCETKKAK